jgi:hypothetical protein
MVISTVDRPGARYLLQSTASILEGLSEKQLKKSQLLIVNTGAPTHPPTLCPFWSLTNRTHAHTRHTTHDTRTTARMAHGTTHDRR